MGSSDDAEASCNGAMGTVKVAHQSLLRSQMLVTRAARPRTSSANLWRSTGGQCDMVERLKSPVRKPVTRRFIVAGSLVPPSCRAASAISRNRRWAAFEEDHCLAGARRVHSLGQMRVGAGCRDRESPKGLPRRGAAILLKPDLPNVSALP
jgi:hypothetical protein